MPWREVGDGAGGEDGFYLAFPDGEDGVAEGAEGGGVARVALFVCGEFGLPEVAACGGQGGVAAALVLVPETAVDEDGDFVFRQYDVGRAGEVFSMQTEAVALRVQELADGYFRLCVLPFHRSHVAVSLFGRMLVHQPSA